LRWKLQVASNACYLKMVDLHQNDPIAIFPS
jgi:hypothetical protein